MFLTNSFFKGSPFHSGNGCNRGISLIALIITIIVIIILAAISIAGVSGVVERSRYAKFCGDLDAVQDAVSQAYGNKLVDQSLQNPTNKKSNEEIYEWIAGGEEPKADKLMQNKNILAKLEEGSDSRLGVDLPAYGDSEWYVDVNTGEVYLLPEFEYGGKYYASKKDIQAGGSENPAQSEQAKAPIGTTRDYAGYYADINGDGEVDGVIFADLAVGGSGRWENKDLERLVPEFNGFEIPTKKRDTLKKYYIKQENYNGPFGNKPVLASIDEENEEKRFYVMALKDIDENEYYWYYEACKVGQAGITEWETIFGTEFGAGEQNTRTMIDKWNASAYGTQNSKDMWGPVDAERKRLSNAGLGEWFVPSREEWAAFGEKLGITKDNYNKEPYYLKSVHWVSSVYNAVYGETSACHLHCMSSDRGTYDYYVRLATTF